MLGARSSAPEATMKNTIRALFTTVLVGACLSTATAAIQARIQGQVKDSSGNPIPDAVITITSLDVATYEKVIEVDKRGTFKVLIIDATRRYNMLVEADGYQSQERPFKVQAGSTENFFDFELASIDEARAARQDNLLEQPGYKEMQEAKELYLSGDKAAARDKLAEAVAELPDFLPALGMLAELNFELGDSERALDMARRCLEEDDESLQCLAVAANASGNLGDTEAQAGYMARYEELNPDDPTVLYNEAAGALNKLDDDTARPLLERCLAVDPEYPPCHFEYGMLLLRSGDMEGAKRHLELYLEHAPDGRDAETARETIKYL
jgi:tetratricopeptide (TPR) repeat protein